MSLIELLKALAHKRPLYAEAASTLEAQQAQIDALREAIAPFVDLFEKRWAEYPSAPDIAPISLGLAMHPKKRSGDLQLSDFRKAKAALNHIQGEGR